VPILEQVLQTESFLEMARHDAFYSAAFQVLHLLATNEELHPLLGPLENQPAGHSLAQLAREIRPRVVRLLRNMACPDGSAESAESKGNGKGNGKGKGKGKEAISVAQTSASATATATATICAKGSSKDGSKHESDEDLMQVFHRVLSEVIQTTLPAISEGVATPRSAGVGSWMAASGETLDSCSIDMRPNLSPVQTAAGIGLAAAAVASPGGDLSSQETRRSLEELYKLTMRPLVYGEKGEAGEGRTGTEGEGEGEGGGVDAGGTDDLKGFSFNVRTLTATGGNSRKRARRLAQELSDLISSLPLSLGSSVWVRSLDGRMDCMQLAISGPEDTPYSNGLFFFDVFFPARYPEAPPQVSHCLDIIFSPTLANLALLCTVLLRLPAITISISTNHRLTHCFFPALGLGTHHHHWIWYSALQSQPVQQRESLSVTPWHMGRWRRRILECRH
jgi:ubiquitin-protein ligase